LIPLRRQISLTPPIRGSGGFEAASGIMRETEEAEFCSVFDHAGYGKNGEFGSGEFGLRVGSVVNVFVLFAMEMNFLGFVEDVGVLGCGFLCKSKYGLARIVIEGILSFSHTYHFENKLLAST
jgi:hypothetical protein